MPGVAILGIGWRLARDEQDMARRQVRELLAGHLQDSARIIGAYFDEQRIALSRVFDDLERTSADIRAAVRQEPLIAQIFVIDAGGTLVHPDPRGPLNRAERAFLADFADLLAEPGGLPGTPAESAPAAARPSTLGAGWVARFRGPGVQLLYCERDATGQIIGALLPRARWMADLIERLPDTADHAGRGFDDSGCTCLLDSAGAPAYRWGSHAPEEDAAPLQSIALAPPLGSWRLQFFGEPAVYAQVGRGAYLSMLIGLAVTVVVMVLGAGVFCREYGRQAREATQRVSFVNQVSHELKTPLTNIRMYAELLETDLDGTAAPPAATRHLEVIVSESQRLSRLIGNVLTFARAQRDQLSLRPRPVIIDEVVHAVLTHFAPALARCGVAVHIDGDAATVVEADPDAVEQILGNLVSNVEKYAAGGGRLHIRTRLDGATTVITVTDDGPGVPPRQCDAIFEPFERLSDRISDAPGTGIGLPIARQLARLHGGDVRLVAGGAGACFEVRLHTPSTTREDSA